MSRITSLLAASLLIAVPANAQDAEMADAGEEAEAEESTEWDVSAPPIPTREISIDVREGTWMSLDVSPDGQTIAFDLLGDIYTIPMSGGEATNIASGMAWEIQPRFSPDGSMIAFTSDRAGGDNIWVMNTDGSDPRQVSDESFRLLNNPTWHPSGEYIAARKHYTTSRSAGTGEIWMYHITGGGGVALVERPNPAFQKELGEPMFSADGRYVYYTQNITSGNTFIYAQDSNTDLFNILRYELETGETETAVSGAGGAVRPAPSPDGRMIAFVRRDRMQSQLWVKDLNSGEERVLVDAIDRDNQESWGVTGMYPNMDWTPDSASIVYWADGGIHRVNVADGTITDIPFHVTDTRTVADPPRPQVDVAPDTFQTQMPRFAQVSPDGSRVVFESLGRLYVMNASGGTPQRLTRSNSDEREFFPSWSRDGSQIVFVTWSDAELGSIRTVSARGGNSRAVTSDPGHYRRPQFSPDGRTIVFEKDSGGFLTSRLWSETTGIYSIPASGGEMERILASGDEPHFGASNDRVFLTVFEDNLRQLISVDMSGGDRRVHVTADMVADYLVSPDGRYVAFRENYDAYVMPMPPGPQSVGAGMSASAWPVTEASLNGATFLSWSHDSAQLNWTMGPTLYSARVADMLPSRPVPEGAEGYAPPETGVSLSITVETARPTGMVALTGARIITMADEDGGVIEDGVVVVNGNRIMAVGARDAVEIPAGAETVDLAGRTIIPGLIDAHAHGPQGTDGIIPQENWSTLAHLAFGVTTIFDPSSSAGHIFVASEYQRAGLQLQPRTYSTGEVVYGAHAPGFFARIDDESDAREHVFRLAAQGAHGIKNYNQPRRDQRQQVVAASHEAGVIVVAEGGANYHMDMSMVADGNTSIEHNLPVSMIYEDVLSMFSQTQVAYNPTIVVTYGGLAGDPYWRAHMNVWEHPILSRHVPPNQLAGTVRRPIAPEHNYVDDENAVTALMLADRGVTMAIGAHGQQEGLAAHWEIWSLARGGATPLQALRAATIAPARHLGFERDLGSIEDGKLADLVILSANPLDDIHNSDDVEMIMLNGRLYEAATMNETVTGNRVRRPYFWE
ncbi:amidohydrolase family protein [Hyphobacterium marinum]|uniref:Amidohydrolase family protein n=1 Tax=Hyphobacterium marinum TaxID=3116574 RepID=A0ABU7LYG3_9PROT|nr:amidohydrolase family protein [Hyphobacterium sp. Y6023]MEE2566603.1 amidohydrolase family protein [Hyphobacterium sp. Y6023]